MENVIYEWVYCSLIRFPHTSSESSKQEMANPIQNPTLKELAAPVLDQQLLRIQLPETGAGFKLKSGLIYLLSQFHGLSGEDPNKHLTEFHIVCASMKPAGVTKEQIVLKDFPFFLADSAKNDYTIYLLVQSPHGLR